MANFDRPNGMTPARRVLSKRDYQAGGEIFAGDPVKFDADGEVVASGATSVMCGVAGSYAAAQGDAVLVYDDPDQTFIIQADESDINVQADINLNYNVVASAGSAAYKMSRYELDSSTGLSTATLPLKLLRINKSPANALGEFVECEVSINNHQRKGGTGTVGV